MNMDLLLYIIGALAWFSVLGHLGAPGLPRMRRSGTAPRRRATPDYYLAA